MKLSKIIQLCKSSKNIQLDYDEYRKIQYISDGYAIYFVEGIPQLDEASVRQLYGINKTKVNIAHFNFKDEVRTYIDEQGTDLNNSFYNFELSVNDNILVLLKGYDNTIAIDKTYLKPFNEDKAYLSFEYCKRYVVVKEGLIKKAIIPATAFKVENLLTELNALSRDLNKIINI